MKQTWQMLRRISGKRKDTTIKYIVTDSDKLPNKTEIADTLPPCQKSPRTTYTKIQLSNDYLEKC